MNIDVRALSNDAPAELAARLEKLIAATDAIQQRQVVNEELQLELVKFLSNTAQRQQEQIETLQRQLADIGTELTAKVDTRSRLIYSMTSQAMRRSSPLGGRIRCVFLVHAIETWDALADLHEAMLHDERFTPIVATINRRYPGEEGFGNEDKTSAYLEGLDIRHVRFGMQDAYQALEILKTMMPDIVFRQSQWDNDIPAAFSALELQFAKLCFVPYASTIIEGYTPSEAAQDNSSAYAYNQLCHRMAWRIYSETRFSAENYSLFHGADPAKVVLSGFPKNERLMQARGSEAWPIQQGGGRRYRVVWAPHHSLGPGWLGFGVFHLIFERMLGWAMQRPDIEFVLKPHPALLSVAVREGFVPLEKAQQFEAIWARLPNCAVCNDQYAGLFASADLLITDGISFLTEFQLFDKPLIYFDSRRHVPFNELGKLAEAAAHVVTGFDELQSAVHGYMNGQPWERQEPRRRLREAMVPRDRPSVEIIMDDIAEGLGVGRGAAAQMGLARA